MKWRKLAADLWDGEVGPWYMEIYRRKKGHYEVRVWSSTGNTSRTKCHLFGAGTLQRAKQDAIACMELAESRKP